MFHKFRLTTISLVVLLVLYAPLLTFATDCYQCSVGGPIFAANVDYASHPFTGGIKRAKLVDCPKAQCLRCATVSYGSSQAHGCEDRLIAEGSVPRQNPVCEAGLSYGPYDESKPRWIEFSTCDHDCLHPPTPCSNSSTTRLIDCPLQINDDHIIIVQTAYCFRANWTSSTTGEQVSLDYPDSVDPQNLCSAPNVTVIVVGSEGNSTLTAYNCSHPYHPPHEVPVAAPPGLSGIAIGSLIVAVFIAALAVAAISINCFYSRVKQSLPGVHYSVGSDPSGPYVKLNNSAPTPPTRRHSSNI